MPHVQNITAYINTCNILNFKTLTNILYMSVLVDNCTRQTMLFFFFQKTKEGMNFLSPPQVHLAAVVSVTY